MWPCLGSVTHHSQTGIRLESPAINSFSLVNLFSVLYYFRFVYNSFSRESPQCITSSTSGFSEKATQWRKQQIIHKQKSTGISRNQLFHFSKINGFCYSFNERRPHSLIFWCSVPIKTRHFVAQWKSEKKKKARGLKRLLRLVTATKLHSLAISKKLLQIIT